jgi:hypothetical protein
MDYNMDSLHEVTMEQFVAANPAHRWLKDEEPEKFFITDSCPLCPDHLNLEQKEGTMEWKGTNAR